MEAEEVTKSEWQEWKRNKVTKKLIQCILLKRTILLEGIAEGHTGGEEARLIDIGKCQALKDITMFVIEDFDYVNEGQEEENVT